jgi:hypothetical protein
MSPQVLGASLSARFKPERLLDLATGLILLASLVPGEEFIQLAFGVVQWSIAGREWVEETSVVQRLNICPTASDATLTLLGAWLAAE